MKRINPKTGKKYNKKTRFSQLPYPYIVVPDKNEITNNYDLYRNIAIMKKHYWLDFAQFHIYRKQLIKNTPFTEQLPLYLLELDYATMSQIVKELAKKGYNPFNDNLFSFDLSPNIFNFLSKRKEKLKIIAEIIKENLIIEKNVLILPLNIEIDNYILSVLEYIGINVVIVMSEQKKCSIFFPNNITKKIYEIKGKTINISNIYNTLKEFNKYWVIEKNILYNTKNTDTLEDILITIKTNIY